jgi:type II secretory pathway component PulF
MAKFIYKAKKSPGEVLEGTIEADSENVAVNKLIESGCYPIWIKEEMAHEGETVFKKIKKRELANFTRQVSELLNSGLGLYNALNVIQNQAEGVYLKTVIGNIKDHIKEGKTFSGALKNYPFIFSDLYVNLVRSGEESGSLTEVLANIADFLDKDEDMRARLIAALVYPGLMAIIGFITIFVLIAFVVPRLVNMFIEMGEKLPLPTRMVIGLSDFIRDYWFLLALFAAIVIFLFQSSKSNITVKNSMDRFRLNIPIFGKLVKDVELARFSRTLSVLLKNGVPVLHSLQITSDVITNNVIKNEVMAIHKDVKEGMGLSHAIKKNTSFPVFIINMTAIGEEGGFLDRALLTIARSYEIEIDRIMKIITALLEPVFILIMGLVVGFIVVAMLLPVFQISLVAR